MMKRAWCEQRRATVASISLIVVGWVVRWVVIFLPTQTGPPDLYCVVDIWYNGNDWALSSHARNTAFAGYVWVGSIEVKRRRESTRTGRGRGGVPSVAGDRIFEKVDIVRVPEWVDSRTERELLHALRAAWRQQSPCDISIEELVAIYPERVRSPVSPVDRVRALGKVTGPILFVGGSAFLAMTLVNVKRSIREDIQQRRICGECGIVVEGVVGEWCPECGCWIGHGER